MGTDELFSTQAAAEYLAQQLPSKTTEQWALWLRNNRNSARRAIYRVKAEQVGRTAFYTPDELGAFVAFEKSRQLGTIKLTGRAAEAMHAFGGTTQGRPFKGGSAGPQVANNGTGVFVQTVINEPLMIFAMTPEQAIEFGKELLEAGQAAQRTSRDAVQNQPDLSRYDAITDNQEIKIMRKTKS